MILLVNGPNLNLLGEREPEVYGHETLTDVERMVEEACAAYGVEVKSFQSNWEGALLDFLQEHRHQAQGVILNPGALTHTSRALADCLRALPCPTVEVHISNIHAREEWRRESLVAPATHGQVVGLGTSGYYYAALHLCGLLSAQAAAIAEREAGAQPAAVVEPRQQRQRAVGGAVPAGPREQQPGPGEPIPVDLNARGEYEPL
jgi:3-dehydroquinate dehydratase II